MKIINTAIEGVYIIEPQVFEDNRGYFFESYNKQKMDEAGLKYDFIQDNQSMSKYGTIRGIHFQKGDFAQAKLVRVLEGTVLDVAVDLRKGSKTFGTRAEIKNVNSFKALQRAIEYEIDRQIDIVEEGGEVVQETRMITKVLQNRCAVKKMRMITDISLNQT